MLIQLKVSQNEEKSMNSLTRFSHPVKKKKKRKKEAQPKFTNTCLNTGYLFLVDRTSRFVKCIKTNPKLWS